MYREQLDRPRQGDRRAHRARSRRTTTAIEQSQKIRRALAGAGGVDEDGDGVVYRTMAAYARDVILTGNGREAAKIKGILGDKQRDRPGRVAGCELLKRVPANTLSGDVAGLIPQQHIAQIFQVIDDEPAAGRVGAAGRPGSRGVIATRGSTQAPVVAVQTTQKTEAGNQGMDDRRCRPPPPATYLGGGDLSWQAINWSTPNALDLWFRLAGGRLRVEDGTGRGTGVAALRVLEQHRVARWRRRRRSRSS